MDGYFDATMNALSPSIRFVAGASLALGVLLAGPAAAQQQPYGTIDLRGGITLDTGATRLHQYWNAARGGEVYANVPFYAGRLEVGGAFHHYTALNPDVPPFDALLLVAGWNVEPRLAGPLYGILGGRVGNYRMSFDEEAFAGVRNESEFTAAAHAGLMLRSPGGVFAYVSGAAQQTFTYIRLKPLFVSFGMGFTMRTPNWLQEVLR